MDQHECGSFAGLRLPVAFSANARAGLSFKFPGSASRKARKSSRQERSGECLCMRIAQQRMWLERLHSKTFYDTLQATRPPGSRKSKISTEVRWPCGSWRLFRGSDSSDSPPGAQRASTLRGQDSGLVAVFCYTIAGGVKVRQGNLGRDISFF
jgi:hypothetical protein